MKEPTLGLKENHFLNEANDSIIEIFGKRIHILNSAIDTKVIPDPDLSDAWVINHNAREEVWKFLFVVYNTDDIKIYLKPIFLLKEFKDAYQPIPKYMGKTCDGYVDMEKFEKELPLIDRVNRYINEQKDKRFREKYKSERQFVIQKVFDFYYSRNRKIKAYLNPYSMGGYSYPHIEVLVSNRREVFILATKMLKKAYYDGILSRKYKDTQYLCKICSGAFLNFREACPKCDNHDLKIRDIIHHFRCATVASEENFDNDGQLICPKCKVTLKNKGVDYDVPGYLYFCSNPKCGNKFQDPDISVKCISCGEDQASNELTEQKIYDYEFTDLGVFLGLK